jgi:hypothetical protein
MRGRARALPFTSVTGVRRWGIIVGQALSSPSTAVGKRTQAQTDALVHDARRRLRAGHFLAIFTYAYAGYESAILYETPCFLQPKGGF